MTLTNTTEQAFAGTPSLKTTGRTAGFHGPSLNLTGQLTKGATYQVGVWVRLVAGEAPTTIRVTMQRTLRTATNHVRHHRAEHERDRRRVGDVERTRTRSRPT